MSEVGLSNQRHSGSDRATHGNPYKDFVSRSLSLAERMACRVEAPADTYRLGPMEVSVRTVGDGMRDQLSPALKCLATKPAGGQSRPWMIYAVDGFAAGAPPPEEWTFPVTSFDHQLRVHVDSDGSVVAADPRRGLWSIADLRARRALFWTRDAQALPEWESGAPYRLLLHVAAQAEGLQLAHAAAVSVGQRGILLAGAGGSGKSTTTLALILDGATTAGEDFVLLSPGKPPIAFALYDTLKLTGMATKVFPEIVAAAANPDRADDEKARIHLLKVLPDRIRPAIPLDAILTLRLGHGGNTHIRPSGPLSAMQALAPSSAFLLRIQMKETLSRIASIARCLPCFEVDLSGNPKEAAQTIAAFASEIPQ